MSVGRIIKVATFALILAAAGSGTLEAQGWKDRARKEGSEYLRKALGEGNSSSTKKKTTKKTTTKQSGKQKSSKQRPSEKEPQVKFFFTKEQVDIVRNFRGPLVAYIGKEPETCMNGTLEGNWTFPAHTKSEREQNRWNDQRMDSHEGQETLSNARLVREIEASTKWIEGQDKAGGPVREFMYTLPSRLDEELYERTKIINEYVELMTEIINAQPDEEREADRNMHYLETKIRNPRYQRATATSMEALSKYLTKETIEFFERRGGLKNAHSA